MQDSGKFYIFATLDPWGDTTLGCWESSNFKDWTYRVPNGPTKAACTSATSKRAGVWAVALLAGKDKVSVRFEAKPGSVAGGIFIATSLKPAEATK